MKQLLLMCIAVLCFAGCNTPSQSELEKQDYGKPLAADYQKVIEASLSRVLRDPASAQISYETPHRSWFKSTGLLNDRRGTIYGYVVPAVINARNGLGGYVGPRRYWFFFRDNELIAWHDSSDVWYDMRP